MVPVFAVWEFGNNLLKKTKLPPPTMKKNPPKPLISKPSLSSIILHSLFIGKYSSFTLSFLTFLINQLSNWLYKCFCNVEGIWEQILISKTIYLLLWSYSSGLPFNKTVKIFENDCLCRECFLVWVLRVHTFMLSTCHFGCT